MKTSYDITVSGYGLTKTYKAIESRMHEEFYVRAIDKFYDDLDKRGLSYTNDHGKFLDEIEVSHEKKYR